MKILVEGDPSTGAMFWRSENSKYYGALIPPFTLTEEDGAEMPMPAGALLAVPKRDERDVPSINKHSPLVIQAPTVDEVVAALEKWVDTIQGKKLWDLRYRYWEN